MLGLLWGLQICFELRPFLVVASQVDELEWSYMQTWCLPLPYLDPETLSRLQLCQLRCWCSYRGNERSPFSCIMTLWDNAYPAQVKQLPTCRWQRTDEVVFSQFCIQVLVYHFKVFVCWWNVSFRALRGVDQQKLIRKPFWIPVMMYFLMGAEKGVSPIAGHKMRLVSHSSLAMGWDKDLFIVFKDSAYT